MQKHQKGQTESPGIRGKVVLNHAEVAERADKITGKSGKGSPKPCRNSRKGRQIHRGSPEKVGLNHAEASERADRAAGKSA